jgi:inner membrane protein
MRYPLLNENDSESAIFVFDLIKKSERWDIKPFYGDPPNREDFKIFLERVKGI